MKFNLFGKRYPKIVQCGNSRVFFSDFVTSSVRVKGNRIFANSALYVG
ncbi:hypothetical protein LEP1GSC188_2405 [Leptospira weilii serovar Topaz str. LT2116]|uniref:Uncharacterized protein n=1 Tax=Leptospira weilii serovar Topaz str. LT2116 TaxID=1088540 RepID=M3G6T3_9LEPT|nr:hypothetical protein LEP1GSC188_2405 [Leptospira weilii serovar Topaz str. LT2116]